MATRPDGAVLATTWRIRHGFHQRAVVAGTALVLNGLAGSALVSVSLAACGLVALAVSRDHHRVTRAAAWVAGATAMGGLAAGWTTAGAAAAGPLARTVAGMTWLLWLGAGLDWPSLRATLERSRVPTEALRVLDRAVLHGRLTRRAWVRRRDAARLRLGRARLKTGTWTALLSEGAIEAVDRAESAERMARARGAAPGATTTTDSTALAVRALTLSTGPALRLADIDLDVARGEWLVVAGASGAGKSSLLTVVAGLAPPTSGEVTRLGRTLTPKTPLGHRLDGRVALLCQNPEHHFIESTVDLDAAWGLLQRGVDPTEAKVRAGAALARLGVAHLADRPVDTLSFGEQRRVALAGLLVLEPSILLLDEPTAALDPVAAETLIEAVEGAADALTTCLWVTHDLSRLPSRARRVVLMRHGRIAFDGPREAALGRPPLEAAGLLRPERRAGMDLDTHPNGAEND